MKVYEKTDLERDEILRPLLKDLLDAFVAAINTPMPHESVVLQLMEIFCENCGVSAGYRTFAWDSAWAYHDAHITGSFQDFVARNVVDWVDYKEYDIVNMLELETLKLGLQILTDDPGRSAVIAKGILAFRESLSR